MIKIASAKGNIQKKTKSLLETKFSVKIDEKKLSFSYRNYLFLFLKHRDIPNLLLNKKIDIGITSLEWIKEKNIDLAILYKLDWCNTKICCIKHKDTKESLERRVCVTEFPFIANEYFKNKKMNIEIQTISGSSEAYIPWLADVCVDCVETGSTLEKNNLEIEDIILESQIVVCTRKEDELKYKYIVKKIFGD